MNTNEPRHRPPPLGPLRATGRSLQPPPSPGSPLLLPDLLPIYRSPAHLEQTPMASGSRSASPTSVCETHAPRSPFASWLQLENEKRVSQDLSDLDALEGGDHAEPANAGAPSAPSPPFDGFTTETPTAVVVSPFEKPEASQGGSATPSTRCSNSVGVRRNLRPAPLHRDMLKWDGYERNPTPEPTTPADPSPTSSQEPSPAWALADSDKQSVKLCMREDRRLSATLALVQCLASPANAALFALPVDAPLRPAPSGRESPVCAGARPLQRRRASMRRRGSVPCPPMHRASHADKPSPSAHVGGGERAHGTPDADIARFMHGRRLSEVLLQCAPAHVPSSPTVWSH